MMDRMIREEQPPEAPRAGHPAIAVIGCGNWGKNLVRNFAHLDALHTVCDLDSDLLQSFRQQYRQVHATRNMQSVFENPAIQGVIISTPSHTHYALAKQALLAGKHVYVEKPVATTGNETIELFSLAEEHDRVLMVGHLLLYHPVVNRLKQLVAEGALGVINSVESDRLNTNVNRPDKSVLWDLAPHDLSMISEVLGEQPEALTSVVGYTNHPDGLIDDAHLDLAYPGGVGAHIHVSWVHPQKRVKLVVRGTQGTAVIDDTLGEDKLHLYAKDDTPLPVEEFPEYLMIEPLKLECQHFLHCMQTGKRPKSDGMNGYRVVQVLEEAEERLQAV
ncbi:MAG: Gfo/Idh/MocA family protein [Candidatus Melainabacteria bacterium]